MAKLRDIKRHIGSVNKIQQITKAMYAISMTRVFKAKQQLLRARAYGDAQAEALRQVLQDVPPQHPWVQASGEGYFAFSINSDRGLCGRFKGEINRRTELLLRERPGGTLILGGDKANLYFRKSGRPIERAYINVYDKPTYEHARRIGDELLALYAQTGKPIHLVYMRYINDFRQTTEVQQLLPLAPPAEEAAASAAAAEPAETVYEPSPAAVFESLVPLYIKGFVYRAIMESKTSEHAIRRQAMRSATDNADELIRTLTLDYNKVRQQEITKQLLDIIGGAEALQN